MNKINYQKELDKIIEDITKNNTCDTKPYRPKLLLHSCCAPCSSYCMEYLRKFFDITVFYYNPNISSDEEYQKRVKEEIRLIESYNRQVDEFEAKCADKDETSAFEMIFDGDMRVTAATGRIGIIEGDYIPSEFYDAAKGYEKCKEGGERCFRCFELRLRKSYETALSVGADFITTTLTISPLKNADKINEIGYELETEFLDKFGGGLRWLPSDFKKRNGYKRSIELSHVFDLYRQNFCGCVFSKTVY